MGNWFTDAIFGLKVLTPTRPAALLNMATYTPAEALAKAQQQLAQYQAQVKAAAQAQAQANAQAAQSYPGLLGQYGGGGAAGTTYTLGGGGTIYPTQSTYVAPAAYYGTGPFSGLESAIEAWRMSLSHASPATPISEKEMALSAALEQVRQVINTLASQLAREVTAAGAREEAAAIREQEAASIKAFMANAHPEVLKDYYEFAQIRDKLTAK